MISKTGRKYTNKIKSMTLGKICLLLAVSLSCLNIFYHVKVLVESSWMNVGETKKLARPATCSSYEKNILSKYWDSGRKISSMTRCPQATWLDTYYSQLARSDSYQESSFLALNIGCNKGYDAGMFCGKMIE